eukprot:401535-Pelagomonas_calceolata.AAC.3
MDFSIYVGGSHEPCASALGFLIHVLGSWCQLHYLYPELCLHGVFKDLDRLNGSVHGSVR